MGISGLLPLLKSIQQPCSLKKFAGQTIGVDAYGWLHRGTAGCAIELALGKPTTKYVDFAMNRVRMLIHFGITPYLVFDGDYLPSKAGTEKERAQKRRDSKKLGLELLQMGKTSQAHLELQKAVDVTPEMARELIEELKFHGIQYIVAPYEADSQLAYLERQGIINGILSEDSDLLVFGARCLITKLDKYGECVEINRNHFTACREVSLVGWSDADFRRMAMLSGCDYLPGIGKMGLKTAYRMLRKHKTVERVIKAAQFDGQFKVPAGYMEAFTQAEMTFLYQWVFCPRSKQLVNLTVPDPEVDITTMPYIGQHVADDIAIEVANGNLNPHTKEPIVVPSVDRSRMKPMKTHRKGATPAQTPDLKKGTKPIDTFFKPKRTPLAELDPNSFTPSPSQQTLLQQQRQSNGWAAVLAPPSTSQSARTSSLRSGRSPPRRTTSDSTIRNPAPSHPKRQRLCSDGSFSTPDSGGAEAERSRFFASSTVEPSPSLRTNQRPKKRNSDFELFSDDSLDDAMAQLVDLEEATTGQRKKKSQIPIFRDEDGPRVASTPQSSILSRSTTSTSQLSMSTFTPATSYGSPRDLEEETALSAALSSKVKGLRSKFTYNAANTKGDASPLDFPPRIGNSSIQKEKPNAKSAPRVINDQNLGSTLDDTLELDDAAWAAMEAEIVVAESVTEVPRSSPIKTATWENLLVKGSEDFLVPDSEAESDGSPRAVRRTLDLGRFAFRG
ncbi:PIN domain-like protein [Westerdykella ornata]|uniref:PIN domain-like protein n=1 Tax=Westerdykella ornata TaxID=318751 RepID=A0A6A6JQV4_WESOR|nr:PIN domain-like protein [Westerdykella ornata]KAF2278483.1 PIN domain-like protein [Westerdykella ornata]